MKKLLLVLSVTTVFALSSCSKCDECSGANTSELNTEFCDDNYTEDEIETAEAACILDGGTWKSK